TDSYTTLQNTQLTGTVGSNDLLQNDSDADPDVLAVNTTPVSNVTNGTLTLATDGSFTYSPSSTFFGNDSFTYQVTDGNGGTDTANVTISVTLKPDVFQPLSSGGYDSTGTWDQGAAPDKDASVLLNNAFTVTQSNAGSLADNVNISGSGAELIISDGLLDVATSVTIATGSKLTNTGGALTVGTTITNAGALLFDDGSIAANSIVNTGTINIKTGVIMTIGPDDVSVPSYYSETGNYYEYVSTSLRSTEAQAAAAAKSYAGATGYLATILDPGENTFIKNLLSNRAWIGLSDTATEGQFRWLDGPEAGQLATYANWNGSREPNNAGGGEDYTEILTNGKWNDHGSPGNFTHSVGYVVEYSRVATTHSNTGTINVDSGATLKFVSNDILENSGDIKGSGTLDFSSANVFKNSGRIDIGDSDGTGILTINGATELKEDSELIFQLAGETKGTQYDALSFTQGVTTLGGRLRINSTVTPTVSATFAIITTTSLAGDFSEMLGLDLSTSLVLDYQKSGNNIKLVAVTVDVQGTSSNDTLSGTSAAEIITGGAGNDAILSVSLNDIVYGQGGDDFIQAADSTFKRVDGGDGVDELQLAESLDYTSSFIPGHLIDHIEILSLEGNGAQTIQLNAAAISQIVDGYKNYTSASNELFVVGDEGDVVELSGDFKIGTARSLDPQNKGADEPFSLVESTDAKVALFVDEAVRLEVTNSDGSLIQYGGSGTETLTGGEKDDHLEGRLGNDTVNGGAGNDTVYGDAGNDVLSGGTGNDILKGGAGIDELRGNDGDDTLTYDSADTIIDGGLGLDTLLVDTTVDLTGLDNLDGIEVLSLANGVANDLALDIDDILNWVTGDALDTGSVADGKPKLVITGDSADKITLNGQDLSNIVGSLPSGVTSDFEVKTDPIGDGNDYISFFNSANTAHLLVNALLVEVVSAS
ncbi:cadherin-like domain-containing protein, partial [Pseudomonadales bacterium]|nr:cadherin-like domain-containing protein [Pseudomonadales bacterium]